jgi:ABC-2 type transport system ATP-binding protein
MDVRRNVGYLPESNPLYYDMYVKEYLAFVAAIYGIPDVEARIQEMIEHTGLQLEQHKQIGQLSKGYKQRVGLAQAMLHNPKVLILDEPTSGLDPNQLVGIRQLIKQLGQHKTVLFSSHIMQEVEAVCDRIIIIDKGKIVADQKTSEVGKSLQGRQSVVVEFDKEIDMKLLRSLPSVQNVKKLDDLNYSVSSHGNEDLRKMVAEWAQQHNVLVLSLRKEDDKLESVFHRLTGQGN